MNMTVKDVYEKIQSGEIISDIELQREIVYDTDKQVKVIDSLITGIPLPAFYFWQNEDGVFEVLDGKQRLEAIKKFMNNDLEYDGKNRKHTDKTIQDKICNTELCIITCSGNESLKREIFYRINTLGVALSKFETLNGLYAGTYLEGLTDYCKQPHVTKCLGSNSRGKNQYKILQFITGREYTKNNKENLYDYVQKHQNDDFSIDQKYIDDRLKFIKDIFDDPSKYIDHYWYLADKYFSNKTVWTTHKNKIKIRLKEYYKSTEYKLSKRKQFDFEEICLGCVSGKTLDIKRTFTEAQKIDYIDRFAIKSEDGTKCQCAMCKEQLESGEINESATFFFPEELEMDHVIPWSKGGKTELSNAQLLCKSHNIAKSNTIIEKNTKKK